MTSKTICASLLFLAAFGCHQRPQVKQVRGEVLKPPFGVAAAPPATESTMPTQKKLLLVWRAPTSNCQQRADAVDKLLSPETSIESARALLGYDGVITREFGPSATRVRSKNGYVIRQGGTYEKLVLEYETPTGCIDVLFDLEVGATPKWRFDHAYPAKSIRAQ